MSKRWLSGAEPLELPLPTIWRALGGTMLCCWSATADIGINVACGGSFAFVQYVFRDNHIHQYSVEFYKTLEAETGRTPGFP